MVYTVLLVEDSSDDIESFNTTLERMNDGSGSAIFEPIIAKSYDEAIRNINNNIDCAIIDIKLPGENSGNDVIKAIFEHFRIPVVVMSGTPEVEDELVKPFTKGENTYEDILKVLHDELRTGLFNVIGGKGIIEKSMKSIFRENLYKNLGIWKELSQKNPEQSEKVILRYTIAHLQELIDQEAGLYEPIEMYIQPIDPQVLKTGTILKQVDNQKEYILLSPPCDLARRENGHPKVDTVILAEIGSFNTYYSPSEATTVSKTQITKVRQIISNNDKGNLYWLPYCRPLFDGGVVNFLKILSVSFSDVDDNEKYSKVLKLQDAFVKSILEKFSTYYSRQGQPDFDFESVAARIVSEIIEEKNDNVEHN